MNAAAWAALFCFFIAVEIGVGAAAADVDFARDIRPILVSRCYRCHSSLKQDGGLRLDSPEAVDKGGDGGPVVVGGKSADSRLLQAVTRNGDLKMPPEGEPLAPAEVELFRRWIDGGAAMPRGDAARHWSFVPPRRHASPNVRDANWPRSPIDAWVARRLDEAQLIPSSPAPRHVLLRRLSLDLIGLPPSEAEIAEFVADQSPDALERVVDRLLARPAHGERWGRHWMDVWRYSDWDGYGQEVRESQPHIWRWRDWIVESVAADKPYNQMIVEMLAGDELAPDDPQTLRATGFLVRNWFKFNRNVWLDNTIEHTGKAFLGVTFNCARCHDHMYDPIKQPEYYQLRAIFEPYDVRTDPLPGQADPAKDGLVRAYDAKLDSPTFLFTRGDEKQPEKEKPIGSGLPQALFSGSFAAQSVTLSPAAFYPGSQSHVHAAALADATSELKKAEAGVAAAQRTAADARAKLAEFLAARERPMPGTPAKPAAEVAAKEAATESATDAIVREDFAKPRPDFWTFGTGKWELRDGKLVQSEAVNGMSDAIAATPLPRDFQLKVRFRTTGGTVYKSVGVSFDVASAKDFQFVYLSAHGPGPKLQFAWRQNGQDHYPAEAMKPISAELNRTYELRLTVRDRLVNVALDGQPQLAARTSVARLDAAKFALWTYDATAEFLSVEVTKIPADFQFVEPTAAATAATPAAAPAAPATEAAHQAAIAAADAALADAQAGLTVAQASLAAVQARVTADQAQYGSPSAPNAKELATAASLAERQLAARRAERGVLQAEQKLAAARAALKPDDEKLKKAVTDAEAAVAAQQKAREAAVMALTQTNDGYTRFGPVYATSSTGRRLALARWIAADDNPLAPRVAVNHVWLRHFGQPLVASVFDFGANGKTPTHPELLDSLARELVDGGWETKRLHRQITTSAVYQLASSGPSLGAADAVARAKSVDPENKLLWRMHVRRMEAEAVRDATLFVSGQLDYQRSGPDLDPAIGMTSPRRSLYFRNSKEKKMTFLALFDSPNVSECYRRSESIAPQQALALANSALSLAQARVLAAELSREANAGVAPANDEAAELAFIAAAFSRTLGRPAAETEVAECRKFLAEQTARFQQPATLTAFGGPSDSAVKPANEPRQRARENLVHVLLNHNDFVAIR